MVLGVVVAAAALSFGTAVASADSATIAVTNTAGQTDPVAGVPVVFSTTGASSAPEQVFVKYRNVGGAPCAATAETDTGSYSDNDGTYGDDDLLPDGDDVNGAFSIQGAGTWPQPGPVQFCIWIAKDSTTIVTPITQVITFRAPTGTVNTAINPTMPTPGQTASVTFTGSTESAESLYATVKPGTGCAPTFGADSGDSLVYGASVNGSFSQTTTFSKDTAGQYTVCAWVAGSPSDTAPVAGPQGTTFAVGVATAPVAPQPPACALIDRSAKRGRAFRVRCYRVSGASIRVRYKRKGRTITKAVALKGGVARAGTRGLAYGSWKVSFLASAGKVGSGRVTVRRH